MHTEKLLCAANVTTIAFCYNAALLFFVALKSGQALQSCWYKLRLSNLCMCVCQFSRVKERMSVQEELDKLLFLVSDQSLTLLPEYHQRIKVWFIRLTRFFSSVRMISY